MNDIITGVFLIVICIVISILAFKFFKKSNFPISLAFILLLGILVRIYMMQDKYLHNWDEKYHALVAKNLTKHPLKPTLYDTPLLDYNYKSWIDNHVWLDKGPIPLWAIASSIKLFGTNEFAVRLPSLLISLLGIYLTFLMGSALFDKRTGLFAAFFHSINGLLIEMSGGKVSSDHVETFFVVFIQLALYFVILSINNRKTIRNPLLIGLFTGLAILTKWSPALLVFPVWIIAELIGKNKSKSEIIQSLFIAVTTSIMIVGPWLIYIYQAFPEESVWVFKKFLFAYNESLEQHQAYPLYYFQNVGMVFGEMVWIAIIISFYHLAKKQTGWQLAFLNSWWLIPFIIFSFAATKRHTYMLIAAPAFFLLSSYYWFYILENMKKRKYLKYAILTLFIVLPIRYFIERTKPFSQWERNPSWAIELKQMKNAYPEKTVFFNYEHAIEGMFYTDYIFYKQIPNDEEISSLENQGYLLVIKDDKN